MLAERDIFAFQPLVVPRIQKKQPVVFASCLEGSDIMRDYKIEFEKRVEFIKSVLVESGAKGIVYGNSGGKDSALVGICCLRQIRL